MKHVSNSVKHVCVCTWSSDVGNDDKLEFISVLGEGLLENIDLFWFADCETELIACLKSLNGGSCTDEAGCACDEDEGRRHGWLIVNIGLMVEWVGEWQSCL